MKKFILVVIAGSLACAQQHKEAKVSAPKPAAAVGSKSQLNDHDLAEFLKLRTKLAIDTNSMQSWISAMNAKCGGGPWMGEDGVPTCTPPSAKEKPKQ